MEDVIWLIFNFLKSGKEVHRDSMLHSLDNSDFFGNNYALEAIGLPVWERPCLFRSIGWCKFYNSAASSLVSSAYLETTERLKFMPFHLITVVSKTKKNELHLPPFSFGRHALF
jgi:hypothetical protein